MHQKYTIPLTTALWGFLMSACGTPLATLEHQPTERFPVGDTFYLPVAPDGTSWIVSENPGNNDIVAGSDGWTRFTPDVPGTYTFTLDNGTKPQMLEVITARDVPFHNLNYLPSRSLASSDTTLVVAQGYTPYLGQINLLDGTLGSEIPVGPWPVSVALSPDGAWAFVAHAGNDTLGFVDMTERRLVDALWVGDAPAEVIVSADGANAYVSLRTEGMVAQVDLNTRTLVQKYPVMPDPRALELNTAGTTLYVAGHRTGQTARYPYGEDPIEDETDIIALDTATGTVTQVFSDVGNVLTDLLLDEDTQRLYVAETTSFPERGLVTIDTPPFESQITVFDTSTGEQVTSHTLQPASEGQGFPLGIQAIELQEDTLWAVTEGGEITVSLDKETLTETGRLLTQGGPRDLLATPKGVFVHASQNFEVARIGDNGKIDETWAVGTDPRSPDAKAGQLHFIRPGNGYGANFSCNSCHLEGVGDTRIWQAGPLQTWETSRPMMWLEGTAPLGWGAYVADVRTFGYTGFTSIINKWPEADDAEELATYLASLSPPPKANAWTQRDGTLSEAGLRGKALYEGKAQCASCHALPLTTSNVTFDNGVSEHRTSTPVLVGAYRHNVWLKEAQARTLRDAIQAVLDWTDVTDLTSEELDDLTRYVQELTDRDFFVLNYDPSFNRTLIGADNPIKITFNQPVWTDGKNLERVSLRKKGGGKVKATLEADGRYLHIIPDDALDQGATYSIKIQKGFEAFDQRAFPETTVHEFETAGAPALHFSGAYTFTAQIPGFNPAEGSFDESMSIGVSSTIEATPNRDGSDLLVDLGRGLIWDTDAVVDDTTFEIRDLPVSFGFSLAQGQALTGTAVDSDNDGIIDSAAGTFVISGPGIWFENREWSITKNPESDCPEGPAGDFDVTVTLDESGAPVVSFDGEEAIGLYVTDYGARLPLGPGSTVTDGAAYWVVSTESFPTGFPGPVTYGVLPEGTVDQSVENGAVEGGATLNSGQCYQFSVISTAFKTASVTLIYE